MPWSQIYDPLGQPWLSTILASLPIVVLLGALAVFKIKAHLAAPHMAAYRPRVKDFVVDLAVQILEPV